MHFRALCTSMLLLAGTLASLSLAQTYPERPVRVLLGLAPGGGSDTATRILTHKLTDVFGQSFVVDNRPGAGSNIATEIVARAAPDGYTLLSMSPTQVINPSMQRDARYHIINDFAPIVNVAYAQFFLTVRNTVPAASVKELIALAKAQRLIYASSGIAGPTHLCAELFSSMAGITMTHVPYKSGSQAVGALLAGETHISFSAGGGLVAHMKAGRVKLLAVTGAKRSAITPDIPTIAESGVPGYDVTGWYGLAAPAKTPHAIVDRLNAAVNRVLPELRERYFAIGTDLAGGTPAEFAAYIKSEFEKWARVVKSSGAKVE
jgi:tripartite-type tricarboxylate transporter receptor subunit TctC